MNTEERAETKVGAGFCPGRQVMDSKNLGTTKALRGTLGPINTNFHPVLWCLPIPDTSSCPSTCIQPPSQALPPSSPHSFALYPPNLLLKILSLEGEQEPAHMVLTQLVDASGIDGSAQELVHLIFRVQSILGTPADNGMQDKQ